MVVAPVTQNTVDVIRTVVIIASTLNRLVAAALDGLGLVLARGGVVVSPRGAVRVQVGVMQPKTGPKCQCADEEERGDDAAGGAATGAVGNGGSAAVVSAAAVGGGCAGAGARAAACGGGG